MYTAKQLTLGRVARGIELSFDACVRKTRINQELVHAIIVAGNGHVSREQIFFFMVYIPSTIFFLSVK